MLRIFLRVISLCFTFFILPHYSFASTQEAKQFVETVSNKALTIIENTSLNDSKKFAQLSDLFSTSVDTNWMGRFAIGSHWRELSEEQKQNYLTLYSNFLIYSYVPKFREYNNQKLNIRHTSSENTNEFTIHTEIVSKEGKVFRVDYRIHPDQQGVYKIFDVVAEGVSLITTQRSDFGALLANQGGNFFLNRLKERISEMKASTS